ncbi:hypothetical protein [Novosphingobium panipatense]|uniref:hypothetical protein n=1 Tax=Novosphingobium panipatense TaxID=428991 RepID=UPI0036224653
MEVAVEVRGLRLSLVFATLQYRVTLTASAPTAGGALLGDMIGAHASMTAEEQLAPPVEAQQQLGAFQTLQPGESATIQGEVQLPLSAIRPLQRGNASLFVPLLRLCLVFDSAEVAPVRRVFTVGLPGDHALAPLRLDKGPMEHRGLLVREVEAARAYPLSWLQPQPAGV